MGIFDDEVEKASEELNLQEEEGNVDDVPAEIEAQIGQVEDLLRLDPSFKDTQDYKDLMAKIEEMESGQAEDEYEDDEYEDDDDDEEYDEEYEEDEDEEDDEDDDEELDDPFGILSKPKKQKPVKLDFEVQDEMAEFISSKYGVEDPEKFFESVNTWRHQAQEGAESSKQLEALATDIQSLPPDIRQTITLWADGEDYTRVFTNNERLDFESDFDNQYVDSLVQHYLPEEYEELIDSLDNDDIDEDEFEDKLTLLARSTKKLFTNEKKALEDERAQYFERQQQSSELLKKSALSSVESLSKSFPNFSKSELDKVRQVLVEDRVDDLFYNADGTYTEAAAEMVANAMFAGKVRDTLQKMAERQGESKANQRIVDSSPKSVRKQKASAGKAGVNTKAVQHLSGVFKGDPYA
jgi:hypothetical protein